MNPDQPLEHIEWDEMPQGFLDEIREKLWTYTVSVFAVEDRRPRYVGTATCVAAGGASHLLTAAHVWQAVRGESLALSLESERLLVEVPKKIIEPRLLADGVGSEWGPDLALLRLPDLYARDIGGMKAFYNLDRRRPDSLQGPPRHDVGLWAVIGAPGEQSTFDAHEAVLRTKVFASGVVVPSDRGDWDYLDLSFDHAGRPHLPESYGGLSGSGLWQMPVNKSASTGQVSWDGTARLEGVAFYQTAKHRGFIRCHGRKSIYVHALGLVQARASNMDE